MKPCATILLVGTFLALRSAWPRDKGIEEQFLTLSRPGEPVVLDVTHRKGDLRITGYDGEVVVVHARLRSTVPGTAGSADSRRMPRKALIHATERNNTVTIRNEEPDPVVDLEIRVPTRCSLNVEKGGHGDIWVHRIEGETVVTNERGGIRMTSISGSAVLNTTSGAISVQFRNLTPNTPMAFTSMGGSIDVLLPGDARALLKMRTDQGEIFRDDGVVFQNREKESRRKKTGSDRSLDPGTWVYGTVNGGGPELLIQTVDGHITVRIDEERP